jgi:hypothetical protein
LHEILESRGFSHERVEALGFREGGLGDLDGLFRAFAAAGEVDGQETVGMPEGIGAKIAYLGRLVLGGRVKPVDFEQLELTPERIAELALRRRDQAAEARNEIAGFYRRSSDVAAALESFLREGDADYASFRRAAGPVSKEALRQSLTAEILSDDAPVLRRYLALAVLQALGGKITDQRRLAEALGFSAGSRAADFLALAALTGGKEVAAGLKAYQDFMRKASGVERADAAVTRLNRELAQAGKPAFARMVEWSAAATIHRSAELSGTELTAARLARSEILRADQDHKVAIPVLAAEGQAVTENAVFESLVNRLDLDRSELDRKIDEGVVRIFVVSGREFSDGHVQEWLGSLGVETLQVFALNEGHWNLSDRLKAIVNLLLMLEGGVVKDATRRISDEIEYIGLLNIQA